MTVKICVHDFNSPCSFILKTVYFIVHHGNGTEAIIRNVNPNKVTVKASTSMCEIKLDVNTCKPWKDEKDGENIFFASVHGFGKDDPSSGYFYPGSGASIGLTGQK